MKGVVNGTTTTTTTTLLPILTNTLLVGLHCEALFSANDRVNVFELVKREAKISN